MPQTSRSGPPLDPEVGATWLAILDGLLHGHNPPLDAATVAIARSHELTHRATYLENHPGQEHEVTIPGPAGDLTLAVFRPEDRSGAAPAIFWVHGGGMVLGTRFGAVEALDAAAAVGAVVVSVEYRLAPEHPSPAPGDDCFEALLWVAGHADDLEIDPRRLVLGGASAGGGLAAATALRLRDHDGPTLAGLLLCCPMLDDRMVSVSSNQFGDDIAWTRASNTFAWRALLGDRAGTDDVTVYEAPGRATDLAGLAPTFVDVGSAELFRDEAVAFASSIWASGGDAELHVWPGGYHGFELLTPTASMSRDAREARRHWLARTLAKVPLP